MDEKRCSAQVSSDSWHFRSCYRKAVVKRDGKWYCKIHDPEYIQKKCDKRQKEYEYELRIRKERNRRIVAMELYFKGKSTDEIEQMVEDKENIK
ncbi:MAG: hypothetical protein ACFFAU_01215 [Candidatus Hodarchaeota archaeon]